MCKISIIVPVYNVEQYISKCIESLINQTIKDIEIILVNDGSTDDSPKICEYYASIDKRIKVIHKKNGGVSDARNVGITKAKGEYIGFIDSDDWINKEMYELLYHNAKRRNCDIAQCGFINVYNDVDDIQERGTLNIHEYTNIELLEKLFESDYVKTVVAWNKIYKKSLFKEIMFPKNKVHEDEFTTYKLIYKSKTIVDIDNPMYYYRQRPESIMSSEFNVKRLDAIDAFKEKQEYFRSKNLNDLSSKAEMELSRLLKHYYIKVVDSNIEDKENVLNYIKKEMRINYINFIKNKNISIKEKLTLTICILSGNAFYNLHKNIL